ncbi:type II secretion system F family protein [Planctomonas psychrotolerans]|uniref:type II secretion system F family protein n=1 Tax=Planctomonas psychrotolerans TaxID=2528712 RepID=UPI00123A8FCA|nr:type II secretion system F family protein [Planctomonas psychrotolerans]
MSALVGVLLGLGLLLTVSPRMWPRSREPVAARPRRAERARDVLARAGLGRVPLGAFGLLSVLCAVVCGALASAMTGVLVLSVAAAGAGAALPTILVRWRSRVVRQAAMSFWPDVVDHLVSAVRSGLGLPESISTLAHGGPPALRPAFTGFERTYGTTGNFTVAVDELKGRLADPTADRILETLRMSRDVGGSELTSVLRSLGSYLRQESAIRGEVEGRQSWVINAARLGVAAPWVILLMLSTRPEAASAYNTSAGALLIGGGLAVSVVAYRAMVRVGRLPEERRWFA